LTEETLKKENVNPTKLKDISQPGQWVSNEYYKKDDGQFRIVMPARSGDQFEISLTDWIRKFKKKAPSWKRGEEPGYVVTLRHLHITNNEAKELSLKDGEYVSIEKDGIRAGRLDKVLVRVSDKSLFRVHLDTDEANALYIQNGEEVDLLIEK